MRRFYLIADPMTTVLAESLGAIHGGDRSIAKAPFCAWMARAMSAGTLAEPCPCCNKPTDMVTDADPSTPIPREKFFSLYREIPTTTH